MEFGRIAVDAERAGALEFLATVAAAEQADAERMRALRREQVPDAVADHAGIADVDAETIGRSQEQVRIGLGVFHHVAGDHRHPGGIDAECVEIDPGGLHPAAGGDGPGDAGVVEGAQQFDLFADLKPPLFVAESTKAIALLEIFRDEGAHLALVVDEYGDLQGLVTLNDLLGAVLGQALSQEVDTGPSDSPVIRRADGSYLVDGSLSAEDLRELMELSELPGEEEHDYNTAAGMVIAHFSRIPAPGETFEFGHWRIEVVDLDGARIDKLLICRVEDDGTEDITA